MNKTYLIAAFIILCAFLYAGCASHKACINGEVYLIDEGYTGEECEE